MKPVRLTLQAFGSYADELDIDFVALAQHGVFSITGPTGSGKTTIFDAMVYALYGEIPGKRNVVDVRSHYANEDTETFVRFEFEVKGVRWIIERKPEQSRRKTRGEGTTTAPATILLRESSLRAGGLTKKKDVDTKVEELIGLTCRQFQQVILLPQGEFEAVLKAETRERTEILRRLFPVSIYRDFTERLKEQSDTLRNDLQASEQARALKLDNIRTSFINIDEQLPDDFERSWDISSLEAEAFDERDLEKFLDIALAGNEALKDTASNHESRAQALDTQIKDFQRKVTEYEKWRILVEESEAFAIQEAEDAKVEESIRGAREIATVAASLAAYKDDHASLDGLTTKTEVLEGALEKFADIRVQIPDAHTVTNLIESASSLSALKKLLSGADAERKDIAESIVELQSQEKELSEIDKAQGECRKSIAAIEIELSQTKDRRETLKVGLKDLPSKKARLEQLQENLGKLDKYANLLTQQEAANAAFEVASARLDSTNRALSEAKASAAAGLAGQLALLLVDGEPCLVCGAPEHPAPALIRNGDDAANIDELELALRAAEKDIKSTQSTIDKITGHLMGFGELPDREAVVTEIAPLQAEVDELGDAETEDAALDEKQRADESLLGTAKEASSELKAREAVTRANVGRLSANIEKRKAAFEEEFGPIADFFYDDERLSNLEKTLRDLAELASTKDQLLNRITSELNVLAPLVEKFGLSDVLDLQELAKSNAEIEQDEASLRSNLERRSEVRARILSYINEGKPQERPQENTELLEEYEVCSAKVRELREAIGAITQSIKRVNENNELLASDAAQIEEKRQVLQEVGSLYLLCSGQNSANNEIRIALEEWVLSDYLKQVLRQANGRLSKISGGRYELHVGSLQGDNRGRHGLDLAVFDAATGKSRWARTMSGGETFLAAMSLALGLADVVTAGSNHELGALFVDEGFGTLDPEKLEMVIQVLDSLLDGGRIVGVISHVEEIKQSIPQGITIESTDRGSVATVHRPE